MKKLSFITLIVTILSLSNINVYAQDDNADAESPFSVSCDLMSRYVWRGIDFGGSPSIQPGIEYGLGNFTIGAWGAFTTNSPGVQEADIYLSYTLKEMFTLTVTDYFFPDETVANYNYFEYGDKTTGHVFETSLSFDGTEKIPFTCLFAANVYGADARKMNADTTIGDIQYSSYLELGYTYKNLNAFMGFNLTDPDESKGETGFYGNTFGVINLGITVEKEITITDKFKLHLTVSLITNPQAEKIYMVAGFSF